MRQLSTAVLWSVIFSLLGSGEISAQQNYKLRQSSSMMGMKSDITIYVKPMRKRTETSGMMGQENNQVTIEQCDKQRTVTLNTKKKLYYIEPFAKEGEEEVIDEDAKPVTPKPKTTPVVTKNGGVITNYYNITDTGERKKMYGFTARHVWTTQKMKPSPDACTMKDSFIIRTDGWYIDLPEFNCPVRYRPVQPRNYQPQEKAKPECKDRFVTRRSGKGKLGFPLIEKKTMIMGGSSMEMGTDIETLELVTGKQDSMLFEIPPDYTETQNPEDLEDKMDMGGMMKQLKEQYKGNMDNENKDNLPGEKKPGILRIGVLEPKSETTLQTGMLQERLVGTLNAGNTEAVPVSSAEDARSKNCDLLLSTDIIKMKQASKVGGMLKAIKNADPSAATSFNIEANLVLTKLADGSVRTEQNVNGKYEGKSDDAAGKALDEGGRSVLKAIR